MNPYSSMIKKILTSFSQSTLTTSSYSQNLNTKFNSYSMLSLANSNYAILAPSRSFSVSISIDLHQQVLSTCLNLLTHVKCSTNSTWQNAILSKLHANHQLIFTNARPTKNPQMVNFIDKWSVPSCFSLNTLDPTSHTQSLRSLNSTKIRLFIISAQSNIFYATSKPRRTSPLSSTTTITAPSLTAFQMQVMLTILMTANQPPATSFSYQKASSPSKVKSNPLSQCLLWKRNIWLSHTPQKNPSF